MDKNKKILIITSDAKLKEVLSFCFDGWGYEVLVYNYPPTASVVDVESIKKTSPDVIIIDVQAARKEQLQLCQLLKNDFSTALIPIITLINKRHLRDQLLSLKQGVDDYLIKPPDPLDLRTRIEMAMRRSHHSIHASSLTGLPGGKILDDALRERIKQDKYFAFAYIDIDHFKYFNDVYGYQRGDRVLLQTAYMLFAALKRCGNSDDFISHIGGDDFAFISTPDKYEAISRYFIEMFDRIIPFHYSADDRRKGFIIARDRTRTMKKIPLMSVSVAIVSRDSSLNIESPIVVSERIAEIKRYLKTIAGSKFMADRRDVKFPAHAAPQVHKKAPQSRQYKPLGQILLEDQVLNYEQLDEALHVHWRKGVMLGEMLKELGFLDEAQLQQALQRQRTTATYSFLNQSG